MDLLPRAAPDRQTIAAYGDGGFRISGVHWRQPMLVMPWLSQPWAVNALADAAIANLEPLLDQQPAVELLLVGCGTSVAALPKGLRADLKAHGIALEPMDTGAACRTYNLLMLESRRVAAALLPV
ncbi:Mth938-like domain-containing protein [Ferrovibrio sp.]|uniref:Mth938-like domain-containing protein n=1 Tax=Ferrovibrio sp. TaxID=1917215 RepID=UPI0025BA26C4|nr:Mth938-like domain-containing protein [Ferrovibrio sp.]MBX3454038.1 hypothetical protein [Ferrovibrio sp.]